LKIDQIILTRDLIFPRRANLLQIRKNLLRLLFVDAAQGEADVDEDVIADLGFGRVGQA
jgi:hypothetical protein